MRLRLAWRKYNFFIFFLLEQKETKIQGETPTAICPAECLIEWRFAPFRQNSRTITNV
jgi:hypothetical protein